ncbi:MULTISPECIES: hypothetical protein [unclassified Neomoorella]|uniref:hypothetical protein n=1 Tax=unclassified Neomoorella TaxID=2676739 RepID=UPI001144F9C2|nr:MULTISPECIES: hypothetical protein [unclassified Moorella (in: firmicutes)]
MEKIKVGDEMSVVPKGRIIFVKGHLWHLTLNTLARWKKMRQPPDPAPFFYIGRRPSEKV